MGAIRARGWWARVAALWLAGAAAAGLAACDSATGDDPCDQATVAGLEVLVQAGDTQIALCDAAVMAQEGPYWEVLVPVAAGTDEPDVPPTCRFRGAFERAGTYRVQADAAGYDGASQTAIEVTQGVCHVIAETVSLELAPQANTR